MFEKIIKNDFLFDRTCAAACAISFADNLRFCGSNVPTAGEEKDEVEEDKDVGAWKPLEIVVVVVVVVVMVGAFITIVCFLRLHVTSPTNFLGLLSGKGASK